jgi:hypothetical protein
MSFMSEKTIQINLKEYTDTMNTLESYRNKLSEFENNQKKVLLVTEQHTFDHIQGAKAVDVLTRKLEFIHLEEAKDLMKKDIFNEIEKKYIKQIENSNREILKLKGDIELSKSHSQFQIEQINNLRIQIDKTTNEYNKLQESYKQQMNEKDDSFKGNILRLKDEFTNKTMEREIVKDKDGTIQNLQSANQLLNQQLQYFDNNLKQISEDYNKLKNNIEKNWILRLFRKIHII